MRRELRIDDVGASKRSEAIQGRIAAATSGFFRLGAIASAAGFSIVSARFLDPSERGSMAFAIQGGYLIGLILTAGRERSAYAGIRRLKPAPRWARLPLVLALSAPILAGRFGSDLAIELSCALVLALAVVTRRMVLGEIVRSRNSRAIGMLHSSSVVLMGISLVFLVSIAPSGFAPWTIFFVVSSALPPILFFLSDRLIATDAADDRASDRSDVRWLAVGDLSLAGSQRFDRVLLGSIGERADLGRYSLVGSLTELVTLPATMISAVRSKRSSEDSVYADRLVLAATFALSLGVCVFGQDLLRILAGPEYVPSRTLLYLLAGAAALIGIYRVQSATALRLEHTKLAAWADLSVGITSIALYLALIPPYGSTGAAIGSLSGYLVGVSIHVLRRPVS